MASLKAQVVCRTLSFLDFVSEMSKTIDKIMLESGGFKERKKRREGETEREEKERVRGNGEGGQRQREGERFCKKLKRKRHSPSSIPPGLEGDFWSLGGAGDRSVFWE